MITDNQRTVMRSGLGLVVLLLAGCVQSGAAIENPAANDGHQSASVPRSQIVPLVDAHLHMMSEIAMRTAPDPLRGVHVQPTLAEVTLPEDLAALLRRRAEFGAEVPYHDVYTDDATVLADTEHRWWKGEALIGQVAAGYGNFDFVPKTYSIDGRVGFVSGNLRSATSGFESYSFLFGLRKADNGAWKIASEVIQQVMPPLYTPVIDADKLIEVMDDAGIRYGVVHSLGFWFGNPGREIPDRQASAMAENDWTVAQAARFPDRLIPFCGVNPLADYALSEVQRCAAMPSVRGMKIHFNNSGINPGNPEHIRKLKEFFRAANASGLALAVHVRGPVQPFIEEVLPEAPDVPIQIGHMASGPTLAFENAEEFAAAIQARKPGTQNLYFDWTQALPIEGAWRYGNPLSYPGDPTPEVRARMASLMRRLGLDRILYGTDMPLNWNPYPREWWKRTILPLPLTDNEIRDIADNVPAYIR